MADGDDGEDWKGSRQKRLRERLEARAALDSGRQRLFVVTPLERAGFLEKLVKLTELVRAERAVGRGRPT